MEQNLVQGNKYLIKRSDTISLIEVLVITETSYKFKYESGNTDWTTKEHFHTWYTIIEDVTSYEINQIIKEKGYLHETKQDFETCPICHGLGTIPDATQTTGTKPCPLCLGNKIILKKVQVVS
jgi:hypothetical protein